jgi:hypothetical protein
MSKEKVFVRRSSVDLDDLFFYKDLDGMMAGAQKIYDQFYKLAFTEGLMVEFTTEWAGYDGGTEVCANFYRWETDKEYQARIDEFNAQEEKKRLKKEARKAKALAKVLADEQAERELYERLHKKFG